MKNSHPSNNEIQEISRKLAIPTTKVENWFKYQRKKSLHQMTIVYKNLSFYIYYYNNLEQT